MYEFWFNQVNPNYGQKVKLCYMDRNRYRVYIKKVMDQTDLFLNRKIKTLLN